MKRLCISQRSRLAKYRAASSARDVQKRKALEEFQAIIFRRFANRILPIDLAVSQRWGLLWAELPRGIAVPAIDSLIGATALEHNLQLVSRNTADFTSIGIAAINPFSSVRSDRSSFVPAMKRRDRSKRESSNSL